MHTPVSGLATDGVWHIGLTGGIGSGKSTVSRLLEAAGAHVIDADAHAHAATAKAGSAIAAIRAEFGEDFIDASGALNRHAMRTLVFGNSAAKQRLQAIVHPLVLLAIQQQADRAMTAGARMLVYDIPLLAESPHWRQRLQHVLVVDCDHHTQIRRVMQRSQLAQAEVEAIIHHQASSRQRTAIADSVIQNGANTNLPALQAQVRQWARHFGLIIGSTKGSAA